jgi:cobalt/nickel transport system permease protein/cobalt/nickel transport protein
MRPPSTRALVLAGLAGSLVLAGVVSLYDSSHPDWLSYVAERLGFGSPAGAHRTDGSPLAGYAVRGISDDRLSGGLAGVLGVLLVAVLAFGLMYALRRRGSGTRTPKGDG